MAALLRGCLHNRFSNGCEENHSPKSAACVADHLRKAACDLTQTPLRGVLRTAGSFSPRAGLESPAENAIFVKVKTASGKPGDFA